MTGDAMKTIVLVDYVVRPDVELPDVTAAIARFVAGIGAHDPGHRYTSYQLAKEPRRFVHVGEIDAVRLPDLQAQPFFTSFSAFLRERCEQGPRVTWLQTVASAR
jgi:hypothetical protein